VINKKLTSAAGGKSYKRKTLTPRIFYAILNTSNEQEVKEMDYMKKATRKDYTAWDLNCSCVHTKNKQKLEKIFRRKARRNDKKFLKNLLTA